MVLYIYQTYMTLCGFIHHNVLPYEIKFLATLCTRTCVRVCTRKSTDTPSITYASDLHTLLMAWFGCLSTFLFLIASFWERWGVIIVRTVTQCSMMTVAKQQHRSICLLQDSRLEHYSWNNSISVCVFGEPM